MMIETLNSPLEILKRDEEKKAEQIARLESYKFSLFCWCYGNIIIHNRAKLRLWKIEVLEKGRRKLLFMELVKLKDVINEIEYYKKELLGKMGDIKVENEVDDILKKYFEEIVKSQMDLHFDNLRNRIENHILLYKDIDSFAERLKISNDKLKSALEVGDIESITVINMEQFDEKKTKVVNS